MQNKPWSGRPPLLSNCKRSTIIQAARRDRRMTLLEIGNRYAPDISIHTINCVLQEANIKK